LDGRWQAPLALGATQQAAHLAAIALVAISAALIMTAAACHREVEPRELS